MEMPATGMLSEGLGTQTKHTPPLAPVITLTSTPDGIHIDMNHLKSGEVKSASSTRPCPSSTTS